MNTCDTCQHWRPPLGFKRSFAPDQLMLHGSCMCPKFIETVGVDDDSADTLNYWDYESYSAGFSVGPEVWMHSPFPKTMKHQNDELPESAGFKWEPIIHTWPNIPPDTVKWTEITPPQDGSYLDPIEATWNTAYPERHLWKDIGPEARAEWRRVFSIYDQIKSQIDKQ